MRYIEVQDGVSIDVDKIEGIKKRDDGTCEIMSHHRKYLCTFPYETFLAMLKEGEMADRKISDESRLKTTMDKLDKVLGSVGHFAG